MWRRIWSNLFSEWFQLGRWFSASNMRHIRDVITEGELHHAGELCFAVEARFSLLAVLNGIRTRQRAEQVFSSLGVWNTADNSGVLVYLQIAERRIEIVADRGIALKVPAAEWANLCAEFADKMREMPADQAVLDCLMKINALLILHFPASADNPKELCNEPIIL
jgi:hypothetical protein